MHGETLKLVLLLPEIKISQSRTSICCILRPCSLFYTSLAALNLAKSEICELICVILLYSAVVNLLLTREILFYCTANHTQIHPLRVVPCGNNHEANFIICGTEHT